MLLKNYALLLFKIYVYKIMLYNKKWKKTENKLSKKS